MKLQNFAIALLVIFCLSCNNSAKNKNSVKESPVIVQKSDTIKSLPDISGYYRLPETGCDLALTITKGEGGFRYFFKGAHLDLEGVALVSAGQQEIYVTFDGPIGNYPPKTVSGLYSDSTLTIQNSGNAMNKYEYFPDCSEKYLEFTKSK